LPSISGSRNNEIKIKENNEEKTKKSLYKVGREEVIVGLEEGGLELVNG
jgi:hypothetical protein